jgi:hypothetical protein
VFCCCWLVPSDNGLNVDGSVVVVNFRFLFVIDSILTMRILVASVICICTNCTITVLTFALP